MLLESVWQRLSEAEPGLLLVLVSKKKTKTNLSVKKHIWDGVYDAVHIWDGAYDAVQLMPGSHS